MRNNIKKPSKETLQKEIDKNGGSLYLSGTQITSLPDNLTVGGSLYLSGTQITSLPDNLTVGGWLDLSGTQITSLPDNLTVGGSLDLSGTQIKRGNVKKLHEGDYVPGRYLYADGILTHVSKKRDYNGYTLYVGKIKHRNAVQKGHLYAHCDKFSDGMRDIAFKEAKDRGADQYRHLTPDTLLSVDEAIVAYMIITGACQQGTQRFVDSLGKLKGTYTVKEIIDLTNGQYGSNTFAKFIKNNKE